MLSNSEVKAKFYLKKILDKINCTDQTDQNIFGINTCFYINMPFTHLQNLTKPVEDDDDEVEALLYKYLQPYKEIFEYPIIESFVDWSTQLANSYVSTILSDILDLGDSKDYPKGLKTTSDYFEDLFEEDLEDYPELGLEDFSKIANIVDTKLQEIRDKYTRQRQLDNI